MAWSVAACLCVHVGSSGFLFVTATAVSLFLSFSCLSPSRARALGFDPTRPVDFFAVLAKTVCAAPPPPMPLSCPPKNSSYKHLITQTKYCTLVFGTVLLCLLCQNYIVVLKKTVLLMKI